MTNKSEVVVRSENFATQDEFLAAIEAEFGVKVVDSAIYSGGEVVDKADLVGVPFVVMDWELSKSTTTTRLEDGVIRPAEFAVVKIRTQNGPMIFTDGGVGIIPVLQGHLEATDSRSGILAKRGLRASEYIKQTESGSTEATTYYFS